MTEEQRLIARKMKVYNISRADISKDIGISEYEVSKQLDYRADSHELVRVILHSIDRIIEARKPEKAIPRVFLTIYQNVYDSKVRYETIKANGHMALAEKGIYDAMYQIIVDLDKESEFRSFEKMLDEAKRK